MMTNEIHFLIVLPTSFCQMFSPRAKIGFDFLVPAAGRAESFASFVVFPSSSHWKTFAARVDFDGLAGVEK
jgi:hypothetical protein